MSMTPDNAVTLPPGTTVAPGRETVQLSASGQQVQGMVFTITLATGATTTVFVPYPLLSNVAYVQQMIAERVAGINAISGLST